MTLLESRAFIGLVATAPSASACGADTTTWGGPGGGNLDRCALLSDNGIATAIGPHHGGRAGGPDFHALYGNASCRRSIDPQVPLALARHVEQRL